MIAKSLQRRRRNRVHGSRADEFLDINHVAIIGILRAGTGPQEALGLCAPVRQCLPPLAAEEFAIPLVGQLRIGDCHFARQATKERLFFGIRHGLQAGRDEPVYCRVDAADKEMATLAMR